MYSSPVKKVHDTSSVRRAGKDHYRLLLRLAVGALFFLILFAGLTLMKGSASGEHPEPPSAHEKIIIIGAGDTLWGIAGNVRKEGQDLRRVVYDLQQRNMLSGSRLAIGQTLIVPAE